MAFNKMRRRPIEHGTISQPIDVDFTFQPLGSQAVAGWSRYMGDAVASVAGAAGVASIQRVASGTFNIFFPLDQVGERFVDADVSVRCSTAGYVASYDAYIGSYTKPGPASTGSYTGASSILPFLTIYTQARSTASLGGLTDVSSLSLASLQVWCRWSDGDY